MNAHTPRFPKCFRRRQSCTSAKLPPLPPSWPPPPHCRCRRRRRRRHRHAATTAMPATLPPSCRCHRQAAAATASNAAPPPGHSSPSLPARTLIVVCLRGATGRTHQNEQFGCDMAIWFHPDLRAKFPSLILTGAAVPPKKHGTPSSAQPHVASNAFNF
jgi:hypothetical protein